jgi:hypothetical protein
MCRVARARSQGLRARIHVFLIGDTLAGTLYKFTVIALAGLSICGFIISTVPEAVAYVGGTVQECLLPGFA